MRICKNWRIYTVISEAKLFLLPMVRLDYIPNRVFAFFVMFLVIGFVIIHTDEIYFKSIEGGTE